MQKTFSTRRFSLAAKLNMLTIALILATSTGICLFMVHLEMTNFYKELLNHGVTIADTTAKNCEFGIYTQDESSLLTVLDGLSSDREIAYATVMNGQGRVLASRIFKGPRAVPELPAGHSDGDTKSSHHEVTDYQSGKEYIDILSPLRSNESGVFSDALLQRSGGMQAPILGYVRLGLTKENLQKRIDQTLVSISVFTSLIVLIGTALTVLLTKRITFPLKRLSAASQEIANGKFDTPIKTRNNDEIYDLAKSLDHMRERLRDYHRQAEERIAEKQRHLLEKEKLMMDLHDGIGGITTNISILSELSQREQNMANIKKTLATISQLSREGVSEIRSFMQSLDSRELTWQALAAEVRKQGAALVDPHNILFTAETSVEIVPESPGSLLWLNIIRIYKEALTNVIKHSEAGSVAVLLTVDLQRLVLIVQDDGIGLRENPAPGRGLPNMKKRAEEVGGRVTLAAADRGTRVVLEIPFPVNYTIPTNDL